MPYFYQRICQREIAKKNFNKEQLTDAENNEYIGLKKKLIEYQRQRELNDPLRKCLFYYGEIYALNKNLIGNQHDILTAI